MPKSSVQRKGKGNVEKQFKVITSKIRKDVNIIADNSLKVAQDTLRSVANDDAFTQKHGADLANYLTCEKRISEDKRSAVFSITASDTASDEIRAELYFAEYGAGAGAISAGAASMNYIEHGRHFKRWEKDSEGKLVKPMQKEKDDWWWYPILSPRINSRGKAVMFDATFTSIPARYMLAARNYARQEIKGLKEKYEKRKRIDVNITTSTRGDNK